MNERMEKSFMTKIYIVIFLVMAIIAVLLYLIFSGGAERLAHRPSQTSDPCEPVITASAEPSETDQPETSDPTEEPTELPTAESTAEPTAEPTIDPASFDDIDSPDSVTKIVSPSRPIDPSYIPAGLVEPNVPSINDENQNLMRSDAAAALEEMFAAAEQEGIRLYLVSGYRSYEFQKMLWDYWVSKKGEAYADQLDSHPGGSEHQLGLACNLGTVDKDCELKACFSDTAAYHWLQTNAYKYGYIERYPDGKQEVTGITYSPWNFRYTGKDAAERIYNSGKTMEEYYGLAS